MKVSVAATELHTLSGQEYGNNSVRAVAGIINEARQRQAVRLQELGLHTTAQLTSTASVFEYCHLMPKAAARALTLAEKKQLSPRGYLKLIKVAQTIADLEKAEKITDEAVQEAADFA